MNFQDTSIIGMKIRGKNPMLSSKLNVLIKYLDSLLMYFDDTSITGIFDKMIEMRGNNLILTSKLHLLLNISAPVDRFS